MNEVLQGRPPHRGAWIEMRLCARLRTQNGVAPRTGGRGLKWRTYAEQCTVKYVAPPHRGAWIEMSILLIAASFYRSPPAQGGVD